MPILRVQVLGEHKLCGQQYNKYNLKLVNSPTTLQLEILNIVWNLLCSAYIDYTTLYIWVEPIVGGREHNNQDFLVNSSTHFALDHVI